MDRPALEQWQRIARQDDWHTQFVGSDIRQIIAYALHLEAVLHAALPVPATAGKNPFASYLFTYLAEAVPERPWWRRHGVPCRGVQWLRVDGKQALAWRYGDEEPAHATMLAALDAFDGANPRPIPEPLTAQVWSYPDGRTESIPRVIPGSENGGQRARLFGDAGPRFNGDAWPPKGAVLVYGPGAPWAPAGWRG